MVATDCQLCWIFRVTVKGIKLSNNTINVVEQSGKQYSENETTGAEYWEGSLNACTTALFYDGSSEHGSGTELTFATEVDGYLYVNTEDAVHNVSKVELKIPPVQPLEIQSTGIAMTVENIFPTLIAQTKSCLKILLFLQRDTALKMENAPYVAIL